MGKIKKFGKILLIPLLSFIIIPLILSIFNLFGIEINKIIIVIISGVILFISGFLIGMKSTKKGYINGLILGLTFIMILFILSLILKAKINLGTLIYYIIILMCTILGSILGINRKSTK